MSEALLVKRLTMATVYVVVGLVPWALLLWYVVANSTTIQGTTDWGNVARVSVMGLLPLALTLGISMWMHNFGSMWRGWSGVLLSWAVAVAALVLVAWSLGPFI